MSHNGSAIVENIDFAGKLKMMRFLPNRIRAMTILVVLAMLSSSACTSTKAVDFKQVAVGFDGPSRFKIYFFENRAEADASWLKLAMSKGEYEKIVSHTDFSHQALVAFAIGERAAASGKVDITRMYLYMGKNESLNIDVLIGIRGAECAGVKGLASYPFVVAAFEKPDNFRHVAGFDVGNFSDGCGPEMASHPTEPIQPPSVAR